MAAQRAPKTNQRQTLIRAVVDDKNRFLHDVLSFPLETRQALVQRFVSSAAIAPSVAAGALSSVFCQVLAVKF
jgi:hypothetical protein